MKSGSYVPEREQRGKRLALILSAKGYHEKTTLCICLPITSKIKGYPFEVALPKDLEVQGVILSDQIKSLDFKARDISFIYKVPVEVMVQVQKNAVALIG